MRQCIQVDFVGWECKISNINMTKASLKIITKTKDRLLPKEVCGCRSLFLWNLIIILYRGYSFNLKVGMWGKGV